MATLYCRTGKHKMIGDNVLLEHSTRLKPGEKEHSSKPDRRRCRACKEERQARAYRARKIRSASIGQHALETAAIGELSAKVAELARSRDEWKAALDRLTRFEKAAAEKLARLRERLGEARTNYDALVKLHAEADEVYHRRIQQITQETLQEYIVRPAAPDPPAQQDDDDIPF